MKRFAVFALALIGIPSAVFAQCQGPGGVPFNCVQGQSVQGNDWVLGGSAGGGNTVKWNWNQVFSGPAFTAAIAGIPIQPARPGGTGGQVQYNAGTVLGGFTVSGDGTLNTLTGALTVGGIGGKAVSLGGNLTTGGAFGLTLTTTATTNVTLPTSGTLDTVSARTTAVNAALASAPSSYAYVGSGAAGVAGIAPASMTIAGHLTALGGTATIAYGDLATSAPTATSSVLGLVKPDNSTIVISGGVLSIGGAGGGVTSLGGLTGAVTCGTNITCSGGTISASGAGGGVTSLGGLTGAITCGSGVVCSGGTITAPGGGSGVSSFNSRTGAITLTSGDVSGVTGLLTTGGTMSGALNANAGFASGPSGIYTIATTNAGSPHHGLNDITDSAWAPPGNLSNNNYYKFTSIGAVGLSGSPTAAQRWATQNYLDIGVVGTSAAMGNSHMLGRGDVVTIPSGLPNGQNGGTFSGGIPGNPYYHEIGGYAASTYVLSDGYYTEGIASYVNDNNGGTPANARMVGFFGVVNKNFAGNTYTTYAFQAVAGGTQTGSNSATAAYRVDGAFLTSLDLSGNTYSGATSIALPFGSTINADASNVYFGVTGSAALTLSSAAATFNGQVKAPVLTATSMPTGCGGQLTGTIWNNGGVANVCP